MKLGLSKFERTAGVFMLVAFAGFITFTFFVAVKQGWFESKHPFKTAFRQGEGLHAGTSVQMSGLRAGSVEKVSLTDDNKIEVTLSVNHEFYKKIKKDSVARVIRPFIIGDKVVEITLGDAGGEILKDGTFIAGEDTMDIMDLLGGGHLGPYLQTVDSLLKNLKIVAEAFADPKRSQAIIGMFDQALPTMLDLREMTQQMTRKKNLAKTLQQTAVMLPMLTEFSKNLPELGENGIKMMSEVQKMTEELNKILPVLAQIAPQLPDASLKGVEAIKEAVVVLKAMQKSFLLRGAVKDVKEEEELNQKQRLPATNEH